MERGFVSRFPPADVAPGGGSFIVFETLQLSRIIASVSTISLEKLHLWCCIECSRPAPPLSPCSLPCSIV